MRKLVISSWLLVVSLSCFGQLADQLPDTMSTNNVIGSYISNKSGVTSKVKIKRNHTYTMSIKNPLGHEAKYNESKGDWKILNDTLFFSNAMFKNNTIKLVMHNGSLHFIRKDGSSDPSALMTKKDYKYYQRQCRQSGK